MKLHEHQAVAHSRSEENISDDAEQGDFKGELVNVPSRHKKPPPHPTRSGTVACLRCGKSFDSWDRTRNRICPLCANRSWWSSV